MNRSRAVLQLMETPGLGAKTLWRILTALAEEGEPVEDVIAEGHQELARRFRLREDVAAGIASSEHSAARLSEQLDAREIQLLDVGSPAYPSKLRETLGTGAPPVLFAFGEIGILERQAVAFSGSRKASVEGLRATGAYAGALAELGINVVSGYASGVDLAAHRGALESGGATTCVLAEGILRFRPKPELAEFLTPENCVVVSEFPPNLGWIARNAMQRNRTICGLADTVIVVEAGLEGGTFDAGKTAMGFGRPLFVLSSAAGGQPTPGSQHFIDRGATELSASRESRPNVDVVVIAVNAPVRPAGRAPTLFDSEWST